MNPSPKVITGPLHPDNKGACDWGYQGFLAYGCHGYIVVVDTKTLQVVQTVGPMKDNVTHVRWSREKYHHAFATGSTYSLILAAADMTGSICIWDVVTGQIRTQFAETGKSILCMEWYVGHDASHDLLAVLRSPDTLELWEAYTGICMWQKQLGDTSRSFTMDPFDIGRIVVLCDCPRLLVMSDITPNKEPSDNITYIQFTDPSPATGGRRKTSSSSDRLLHRTSQSWTKMATLASSIIMSSPEPANKRQSVSEDDTDIVTSCLQAVFNRAHRHFLILLFPTELQILDLEVELVIGVIRLDKSSPNFVKVIPFQFVDMMLCLHENGSASLRIKRETEKTQNVTSSVVAMDTTYDLCCQSDALRLMRQSKVYSFVYQPVTERQACIVISDSKVILLDLMKTEYTRRTNDTETIPPFSLSDLVKGQKIIKRKGRGKSGEVNLKLITSGLLSGVISPATSVALAPSHASSKEASKILAVGSGAGTIQLVNVHSGQIEREYKVFMSPIRYLEWLGASRILTYTYPDPPSYGNKLVKNEVILINIHTGCITTLRESKVKEGPILFLKASPSRKFFAVVVQDKPLELWDIGKKQMNREVNLHLISNPYHMCWHPHVYKSQKKVEISDQDGQVVTKNKSFLCEQLFIIGQTDMGNLVKFSVLDGYLSDKVYFTNEVLFGTQNVKTDFILMAWKNAFAVIADKNGPVYLTDGHQKKKTKKFCDGYGRSALKILFAPGTDNERFFILYPDQLNIWNIVHDKVELEATSASIGSVIKDAAWAGPDSVVILTEDSSLHVMVIRTKKPTSPVSDDGFYHVHEAVLMSLPSLITSWKLKDVFSPALFEAKHVFNLKYSLQCNVEPFSHGMNHLFPSQDSAFYNFIREGSISTADRCYMVARLFGDENDMEFWRLYRYRIANCKPDGVKLTSSVTDPLDLQKWFSQTVLINTERDNLIDFSSDDTSEPKVGQEIGDMDLSWLQNLDTDQEEDAGLDVFMNAEDYKAKELSRLGLWNKRRYDYRVKQLCTSRWVQIDKREMAVTGLMETDMGNSNFKSDFFKACLTSCIETTSTSLSMIKLAATHLIAGGYTEDGVDLLCLINKRLDACKYLIANGQWTNAVWLAKTTLAEKECLDIICKWTEHLWNNCEQKSMAVLLMMSMGQFTTVLRMLCDMRQYDMAAMFLQACKEHGVISPSEHTDSVYIEFAKILAMTEYQSAVHHYCHLAGERGKQLLADLNEIPTRNKLQI